MAKRTTTKTSTTRKAIIPIVGSKPIRLSRWEGVKIAIAGIGGQAAAWVYGLASYCTPDHTGAVGATPGKLPAVVAAIMSVLYAASLFVNNTKKKT